MDVRGGKPDYTGIVGMFQIEANVIYKTDRGKLVVGVIRFLDEEIQDNVPVYALPEGKDSFTGLINKCACQEYVKDAIAAENCRHYMAIVDVDNFKVVNDTCGHLYGDKVILEIASILNSALNGRGVVSHFGGDEFLILPTGLRRKCRCVRFSPTSGNGCGRPLTTGKRAVKLHFPLVFVQRRMMERTIMSFLKKRINAFIWRKTREETVILFMMRKNTEKFRCPEMQLQKLQIRWSVPSSLRLWWRRLEFRCLQEEKARFLQHLKKYAGNSRLTESGCMIIVQEHRFTVRAATGMKLTLIPM